MRRLTIGRYVRPLHAQLHRSPTLSLRRGSRLRHRDSNADTPAPFAVRNPSPAASVQTDIRTASILCRIWTCSCASSTAAFLGVDRCASVRAPANRRGTTPLPTHHRSARSSAPGGTHGASDSPHMCPGTVDLRRRPRTTGLPDPSHREWQQSFLHLDKQKAAVRAPRPEDLERNLPGRTAQSAAAKAATKNVFLTIAAAS